MSGMPREMKPGQITGPQARAQLEKSLLNELAQTQPRSGIGGSPSFNEAQQARKGTGGIPMMSALNYNDPLKTAARGGALTGGGISGNQGAQVRGGLLGNLSNPTQPPSMMNNFTDKLLAGINNPLFQLGASLQNRRQSLTDNLADFRKNMMQQQLFQKQLSDSEFDKLYKKGLLDVQTLTAEAALAKAGIGKRKPITLMDEDKNKITAIFDDKGQYLYADGTPIPAEELVNLSIVKEPSMQYISGKSPGQMQAEADLQLKLGKQKHDLDYLYKDVLPGLDTAKTYRDRVQNIMDIIDAGGMTDKGGGMFAFGQEFMSLLGIDKKTANVNEVAQAFQRRFAPELRVPGSGATTDYEMRMYLSAFPSLQMTPGGRDILTRVANTLADRANFIQQGIDKKLSTGDVGGIRNDVFRLGREAEKAFPITTNDLQAIKNAVSKEEEERLRIEFGYGGGGVQGNYSFKKNR